MFSSRASVHVRDYVAELAGLGWVHSPLSSSTSDATAPAA